MMAAIFMQTPQKLRKHTVHIYLMPFAENGAGDIRFIQSINLDIYKFFFSSILIHSNTTRIVNRFADTVYLSSII